jgi:hypothetical protein
MYDIKINNRNFTKIIEKYNNNTLSNFIIINKIKKYNCIKNKVKEYTTKYKNNIEKEISIIHNKIINLETEVEFENIIKKNLLKSSINLNKIHFNIKKLDNTIKLFTYDDCIKFITKKFISELYFYKFFKNNISISELNAYKVKYNHYLLEKIKNNNNYKKNNKKEIIKYKNEILKIKNKINIIRKDKFDLYLKNNLISKNIIIEYDKYYPFDNKEIYLLKQKVIELTNKIKHLKHKKNKTTITSKFNLINLEKKKIVLPIIKNNDTLLLNYNLKTIFTNKITSELELINKNIENKKEMIRILLLDKNIFIQLFEYKMIDTKLVTFYNNKQEELNNLEKEIIKDYLFLNKK